VNTVVDLAARWKVNPAAVLRWRNEGLGLRFFRFDRGKRKAGVRESLAARFETDRARVIRHARTKRRLSDGEKRAIVEEAVVGLAREEPPGRILAGLSRRLVLGQSTIERLVASAARDNPALRAFARSSVSRREGEAIFNEFAGGADIDEIAGRHGYSTERIRRILLRGRAKRLLRRPLKFIASREFEEAGAEEKILAAGFEDAGKSDAEVAAADLPVYLKGIAGAGLLTKEEEVALFRKYNYIKFKAAGLRGTLDGRRPDAGLVERIEELLAEADRLRERLVRSNLRLVASIARRHYGRQTSGAYLISEGNMALLDAVEAFDYTRGNRFSTYAGWAIIRRFARMVPEENYRIASIDDEILTSAAKVEVDYTALAAPAIAAGVWRALGGLSERERAVLEGRFGLGGLKKPRTLAELGAIFGVTKERIRQIEARALARLRRIVESTAPELLPE